MEIPAQDGSYVSRESDKGTQSEVGFKLTPYKLSLLHVLGCYLSASSMGSRLRSAVSLGSLNHDFIGIALSMGKTKQEQYCKIITFMEACLRHGIKQLKGHYELHLANLTFAIDPELHDIN